jgi:hypothetical protein
MNFCENLKKTATAMSEAPRKRESKLLIGCDGDHFRFTTYDGSIVTDDLLREPGECCEPDCTVRLAEAKSPVLMFCDMAPGILGVRFCSKKHAEKWLLEMPMPIKSRSRLFGSGDVIDGEMLN